MSKSIRKLKKGDFNDMSQDWQADGSVIITLSSRKYPEVYRFRVKDLYGKHEKVLDEEVIKGELP